jgi:hypothetical protein
MAEDLAPSRPPVYLRGVRPGFVNIDPVIAFSNRLYVKINNVIFIVVTISFDRAAPLAECVILSLVLVDFPYRSVLSRYKDSSPTYVGGALKPVLTGLSGTFPGARNPSLLIPEDNAHAVIEAIGLVVPASNTDDVQVVLALLKYSVPKRGHIVQQYGPH